MKPLHISYPPGRLWALAGIGEVLLIFGADFLFLHRVVQENEIGDLFLGIPIVLAGLAALSIFAFKELIWPRTVVGGDHRGLLLGVSWPFLAPERVPWWRVLDFRVAEADLGDGPRRALDIVLAPGVSLARRTVGLPEAPRSTVRLDQHLLGAPVGLVAEQLRTLFEGAQRPPLGIAVGPLDQARDGATVLRLADDAARDDQRGRTLLAQDLVGLAPDDVLVARTVEGEVIGAVAVLGDGPTADAGVVRPFGVVAPAWRRHGIGRVLQRAAERRAIERAAEAGLATATVTASVQVRHEALGPEPDRLRFLVELGYRPDRTFLRLRRPADLAHPEPPLLPDNARLQDLRSSVDRAALLASFPSLAGELDRREPVEGVLALAGAGWEGRVVGYVLLSRGRPEAPGRREAWIDDLGVADGWRDRGIGAALLVAAVGSVGPSDVDVTLLTVPADGALDTYSRLGFTPEVEIAVLRRDLPVPQPAAPAGAAAPGW